MTRSILKGIGSYLPEKILTNNELEATIDTTDVWIRERTGIAQRHIAAQNEYTSDLAVVAAKNALQDANMSIQDIDLIIVATTTPDEIGSFADAKGLFLLRGCALSLSKSSKSLII